MFYYVANVPQVGEFKIYMGKDKYENEGLIKHGWPEDVWFHVDNLSSAHVYVRLPRGPIRKAFREKGTLDHVPQLVEQCCQLVKANSIEGCKKSEVDVVYTEWENLRKAAHMADGQVGFNDEKKVIKVRKVPKNKELLKQIEKTKTEAYPDLAKERADRDAEVIRLRKQKQRLEAKKEKERLRKLKEEADRRDLKHLMKDELMVSNDQFKSSEDTSAAVEFEEDFM